MVVRVSPHYTRASTPTVDHVWPDTPFVTVLTDIADYPPHFWIERQEQHVICGAEMAARQARELGIPEKRVLRASGMILNPSLYRQLDLNRRADPPRRAAPALPSDRPPRLWSPD